MSMVTDDGGDQADLNDKASIVEALKGSYAVFAVTNYWEKMDDKLEVQQGKNLADAAKVCDIIAQGRGAQERPRHD